MVPISLFQFILIYLQVASLCARGLAACYISGDQHDECVMTGALEGSYRLVLFTPEMLLEEKNGEKCCWALCILVGYKCLLLMRHIL